MSRSSELAIASGAVITYRDIVVVGSSAGGVQALQALVSRLNPDLRAAIFVVSHTSPEGPRLLAQILGRVCRLSVDYASSDIPIEPGTVKIAPPDLHLILRAGRVHLARGPKHNRARPAIDPLFRSAANAHGPRVIGVLLSGLLDDGVAGLLAIQRQGGTVVVQDPNDARYPDMPRNALSAMKSDYCLPAAEIGSLLNRLTSDPVRNLRTELPLDIEVDADMGGQVVMEKLGKPSAYTCPECAGVLWEIDDPDLLRFRCRVGHAFSSQGLDVEQHKLTEDALWAAVRALEEAANFSRRLAERCRANELRDAADAHDRKAQQDEFHAKMITSALARLPV